MIDSNLIQHKHGTIISIIFDFRFDTKQYRAQGIVQVTQ